MTDSPYRLPSTVVPSRYDLVLEPDLEAATFIGVVDVAVTVAEPVDQILLNAVDLAFDAAWVTPVATASPIRVKGFESDVETERATLELESQLPAGEAVLHIEYRGTINNDLKGFYRSTYTDDTGEHVVAVTQCEPTSARIAFPCWDEPAFKAVFGLTLVVADGLSAFANGPEVSSEPTDDGRRRVVFADTMKMSTYLTAWCVGRLEVTEPVMAGGTPVRVIHVPGKGHLAAFAAGVAVHSLGFFTNYYAIDYPEQKLDLVALPDFAAGAMENPGLVTFREAILLVDPAKATQVEQQRIADTIQHEIAHMWFGDLVTMRWWNGIWLNEAFATFMALLATNDYRPDWRVFDSFATMRAEALEVDGLLSTRSIEYEVIAPSDIEDMFDVLTYEKGASVLWMLEQHLGREPFRDGIRAYLAAHAYGNTETYDLWDALESATGEPVRRVMDAWIWQGGYPLIDIERQGTTLRMRQSRFTYAGEDDGTRWPTPYRVRIGRGDQTTTERILLEPDGAELQVPPDAGLLVVGDADAVGFVRTRYDDATFTDLVDAVATLQPLERFVVVDDTWAAVTAGAVEVGAFISLVERFADEDDHSVWKAIVGGLSWCDRIVEGEAREGLRAFVRALARPALDRLGWKPAADEHDLRRELRGTLVSALGMLGRDEDVIERAVAIERAARAGEDVDASLASAATPIAASVGAEEEWEAFVALYRDGDTPQMQRRYLRSLGAFRQPELMERTFAKALDGYVRSQDRPFAVGPALASRDNGPAAWELIKSNWDALTENLTPHLGFYMIESVRTFTTQELRDDALAFIQAHPLPGVDKLVEHALERQSIAVALRVRASAALTDLMTAVS